MLIFYLLEVEENPNQFDQVHFYADMHSTVKFPQKIDVYAFGVVLYELVLGKEVIIKTNEIVHESKGLVALVVFPIPS